MPCAAFVAAIVRSSHSTCAGFNVTVMVIATAVLVFVCAWIAATDKKKRDRRVFILIDGGLFVGEFRLMDGGVKYNDVVVSRTYTRHINVAGGRCGDGVQFIVRPTAAL